MAISYKLLAAGLIFLISILTALYPLRRRVKQSESFELGEAFASGIFLGVAFFHMLPDAITLNKLVFPNITYPFPELVCLFSFLLFLFLEQLSIRFNNRTTFAVPYVLAIILTIHAFIEGAALGIDMHPAETFALFIAIIAHKGSETFALCVTMLRYQTPLRRIMIVMFLFACVIPLGIAIGSVIDAAAYNQNVMLIALLFKAFAAGTFIYISTLHHIRFHAHADEKYGLLQFGFLVLGVILMGILPLWV